MTTWMEPTRSQKKRKAKEYMEEENSQRSLPRTEHVGALLAYEKSWFWSRCIYFKLEICIYKRKWYQKL